MNTDCPPIYCKIRSEYLYNLVSHTGQYEEVVVFGVSSIHGRAIGFHVLTKKGAQIARVPIIALVHQEHDHHIHLRDLELWDCFSYNVSVWQSSYLNLMRCDVELPEGNQRGTYQFTVDWYGNNDSENPGVGGFKNAHIIALDCGCFTAQPNNRIIWDGTGFVSKESRKPDYVTNTHIWKCE